MIRRRQILIALLVVLVIGLGTLYFWHSSKTVNPNDKVKLSFINEESVADEYYVHALIMRDSHTLKAPSTGMLTFERATGNRLAKDENIGYILSSDEQELFKNLRAVKSEMLDRQYTVVHNGAHQQAANVFKDYEVDVRKAVSAVYASNQQDNLQNLANSQEALNSLLNERNSKLAKYDFNDDPKLVELKQKIAEMNDHIKERGTVIKAGNAGVLAHNVYASAEEIKTDDLEKWTVDQVKRWQDAEESNVINHEVQAGDPIGTLTDSSRQYFACILTKDVADKIQEDTEIKAEAMDGLYKFNDCHLERLEKTPLGSMLIFRADDYFEDLVAHHNIELKLKLNSQKGLKVPLSALFNQNGKVAEIYLVTGGIVVKAQVDVVVTTEDSAIIASPEQSELKVQKGDMIVINPSSANEGQVIADNSN